MFLRKYRLPENLEVSPAQSDYQSALAASYQTQGEVYCACRVLEDKSKLQMSIAQIGEKYIVRRLAGTGQHHHTDCFHYQEASVFNNRSVLGKAIEKLENSGKYLIRPGFPLSKAGPKDSITVDSDSEKSSVVERKPDQATCSDLVEHLVDIAELNKWGAHFRDKRSYGVVSSRIKESMETHSFSRGIPLSNRMFVVPGGASTDLEQTVADITQFTDRYLSSSNKSTPLGIVVGEFKQLEPHKGGYRLSLKRLMGRYIYMPAAEGDKLRARLEPFQAAINNDDHHLMVVCTVWSNNGYLQLESMHFLMWDQRWLPYQADSELLALIDFLDARDRRFDVVMMYQRRSELVAAAVLTDCDVEVPIFHASSLPDIEPGLHADASIVPALAESNLEGGFIVWDWRKPGDFELPPAKTKSVN